MVRVVNLVCLLVVILVCGTQAKTIGSIQHAARDRPTAKRVFVAQTASQDSSARKERLFGSFGFKGFALSMQKALTDWTSGAMGIKIPVTPNFPNYESKVYLPRVTAFVGVGLPASLRFSMTASVPTQALVGLALLGMPSQSDEPFKWPSVRAGDHVKRLGLTMSCRMGGAGGLKPTVGAVFMFLPGALMVQYMLPMIILAPALALTLLQVVLRAVSVAEHVLELLAALLKTIIRALALHAQALAARSPDVPYYLQPILVTAGWRAVSRYLQGKSNVFTFNFGYNQQVDTKATSTSAALQYDLAPFFPQK